MTQILMPKATAVWLIDNTGLTFKQISEFCVLHILEVEGIDNRAQFLSLNEKSGVEHPALQEFLDSESCKPRFIGLINGNVVANVEGALSPAIVSAVMDNLPEID